VQTFANELKGVIDGTTPPLKKDGRVSLAAMRRSRATITLANQQVADTIVLGDVPEGGAFAYAVVNTDTALGGAQLQLGVAGAPTKYANAFGLANANAPAMVGNASAQALAPLSTAPDRVIATIGGAALPGAGTLVVDLFYSMR
jgi:hypothetical protein